MSSDEIVKGECQHCKGHIEFPSEMKGQKVDCPHCSKETWLTPPVPKKSQGDEKALDALKSGVGELAKAASIVAKKATDKAKEIAASDEVKNLKDKAGKAASELRDKANERVEGIQADPAAFKKRLVPIAMAASVILGFWLIRYQPWKSEFDRTLMWAERGDADAQHSMGQLYLGGEGVGKDTEEAASWFEKAAEQGHVDSMFNLGLMYSGVGGRRNDSKSRDWYQKAADGGDEEALSALGDLYLEGRGVRRDYAKAMELFSQSESVSNSLFQIGRIHDRGLGVKSDLEEAIEWWRKGARIDHPGCLYNLGSCYETGDGVRRNMDEAADFYGLAAELDYPEANYNLGVLYSSKEHGLYDPEKSLEYTTRAHELGFDLAVTQLAYLHMNGIGVKKSQNKGIALLQDAAKKGNREASKALGQVQQGQMMQILGAAFSLGFGGGGGGQSDADYSNSQMDAAYQQWKSENPSQFMR